MKKKVVVFGAGDTARMCFNEIKEKYEILYFVELDDSKIGGKFCGYDIYSTDILRNSKFDEIILCVLTDISVFYKELERLDIDKSKINDTYSLNFIKPRITLLKQFSKICYEKNISGSVAEAGVFRGEFAKHINNFFPDRKFYLYDTFEGFDVCDIKKDDNLDVIGNLKYASNTSVELVMSKMTYPQNCIIKKGYFPNTAKEDDEIFCFVNIDMDLYDPVKAGLEYFYPKMSGGGLS